MYNKGSSFACQSTGAASWAQDGASCPGTVAHRAELDDRRKGGGGGGGMPSKGDDVLVPPFALYFVMTVELAAWRPLSESAITASLSFHLPPLERRVAPRSQPRRRRSPPALAPLVSPCAARVAESVGWTLAAGACRSSQTISVAAGDPSSPLPATICRVSLAPLLNRVASPAPKTDADNPPCVCLGRPLLSLSLLAPVPTVPTRSGENARSSTPPSSARQSA